MKCPECKGELEIRIAFPHTDKCTLPCTRCNSTGEVPEIMTQWIEKGKDLKNKRIGKKIILLRAAKIVAEESGETIKDTLYKISNMERGVIEPDMCIYDILDKDI